MKKKLLVLVAMLLCVVTVLASCASSMKFEKVVGDGTYNDENPTLTAVAKLDLKGTPDLSESAGDLVLFVDYNAETELSTYTVYNLATNATVWTGTESKTESGENSTEVNYYVNLMEQWDTVLVVVSTVTITRTADDVDYAYDYKLLTSTGAEIVSVTDVQDKALAEPWFVEDLICIDGKVYRIADDGTVAHAFDWSELRGEPDEDIGKVGDFYLGEMDDMGIAIYDASLNLITTYYVPSYAVGNTDAHVLSNGNILVQYSVAQDIMAEDYDYIEDMTKYNLCSLLINAETGKVKELKLDYVIDEVWAYEADDEDWYFNEKIENVAWVNYIVDQRIDYRNAATKMVSLTNKGKVAGVIDNLIPNMGNDELWHVATNRWVAENMVGQLFLLNEKGEILGEVTGIDNGNANFFTLNGKIYDWDLNVKLNLVEQKADDYEIMAHSVLFENEDGEWKLYINGEVKTLIDKATAEAGKRELIILSDALYVIIDTATEGTVKYEIYNDAGTLLTTVDNATLDLGAPIIYTADSNNAVLIVGTDAELKTVYYRVG